MEAVTKKDKYMFTVRFPFEAYDAVDARLTARMLLKQMGLDEGGAEGKKLQRLFRNKEPQKIEL